MKLCLGVVDLPYAVHIPEKARRAVARTVRGDGKDKAPKTHTAAPSGGQTTYDVASILEAEYGIFQVFFDQHTSEIAEALEDGIKETLESLLMGAPVSGNPFSGAEDKIGLMFRNFLDSAEMDGHVGGVPTKAALAGVSHRFKNKKRFDAAILYRYGPIPSEL